MSVLKTVARFLPFVPRAVEAIRDAVTGRRRELDRPLGESEAARALRLEQERRDAEAAERARRAKD